MPTIKNLGVLEGAVLLFGGPYSNLEALQALMKWADQAGIAKTQRICTGDVVAYCGDPVATIALMKEIGGPVVAGNCEIQLANSRSDCGCGFEEGTTCAVLSEGWYQHVDKAISTEDRQWFASCPDRLTFQHHGKRYVVIHGGASDVSRFLWPISFEDDFWDEISLLQEEVGAIDAVISGHCGIAFERNIDGIEWINAGVIGMPANDGQPDTVFAVLDKNGVTFQPLPYDVNGAVGAMKRVGLIQGYEKALQSGHWPSEDILPKSMRRL